MIDIKVLLTDRFTAPREWRLRIPAMPPTQAADLVFHLSNCPPPALSDTERQILAEYPRTGIRSVSLGDILIIEDAVRQGFRHIASVSSVGFKFH